MYPICQRKAELPRARQVLSHRESSASLFLHHLCTSGAVFLPSFVWLPFFSSFFLYSPIQSWLPQSDRQKAQGPFFLASHWNLSSRQQLLQGCQIDASLFCGLNEPSPPAASATNQCCCTSTAPGYHLLVPSPAPSRPP